MNAAYKILFDHKVDSFRAGILGTSLGMLIDHNLTDTEILIVVEYFCTTIRVAANDPRMLDSLQKQAMLLDNASKTGR